MTLTELNPLWSRDVVAPDHRGIDVRWRLLDTHPNGGPARITLLCVHGNPTWSYMWRNLIEQAPADVRVIAVDQLDMGWSERTGVQRRLQDRIDDLDNLTHQLDISGPVVIVAHDWGGPIALGWSLRHRDQLRAVVLLNTAVHQPEHRGFPFLIAAARRTLDVTTRRTPLFVRATAALSGRRMSPAVAAQFRAPYGTPDARRGVRDFVDDIPVDATHPSWSALNTIAEAIRGLHEVPVLLVWGAGDPVFSDRYLHDLQQRLPHAQVQRYASARHLVLEDEPDAVRVIWQWLSHQSTGAPRPTVREVHTFGPRLWQELVDAAGARPRAAAVTWTDRGHQRQVPWQQLHDRVMGLATGLSRSGIAVGDRVSLLIPPSPELVATVYALWRIGASAVIVDAGLGVRAMRRALRSAAPDHCIGIPKGIALSRSLHIPGLRITTSQLKSFASVIDPPPEPPVDAEAVVAFTSGATGPAKGVVYTQAQVQGTRDAIKATYDIGAHDALVAAFAPWAVLGPALGIPSAIPDMDVSAPRTLTANAVAEATASIDGTIMWASPAALRNVLRTAHQVHDRTPFDTLRLVMAAGAPVSRELLVEAQHLFPNARVGTPYGMTEVLPVCDVELTELEAAGAGNGVLVGAPIQGVEIAVRALDVHGEPHGDLVTTPHVTGEIHVRAPHMRERYDRLAAADVRSPAGWHATGDVGHRDSDGRLWVEGRLQHVIVTEVGVVTPVGIEQLVQTDPDVDQAAVVGVGPVGNEVIVIIVTGPGGPIAAPDLTARIRATVRQATGHDVAAVLVRASLPTDLRHNAKVDRVALRAWADTMLQGRA